MSNLVEIGPVILEKKNNKFRQCIVIISLCSSLGKGGTLHLEKQQDFPSARDDLCQVWLNWLGDSGEKVF